MRPSHGLLVLSFCAAGCQPVAQTTTLPDPVDRPDSIAPSVVPQPQHTTGFRVVPAHCYDTAQTACIAAGCPTGCRVVGGPETSPVLECGGTGIPELKTEALEGIVCVRLADPTAHATRDDACLAAACPSTIHDYCADESARLVACHNGGW